MLKYVEFKEAVVKKLTDMIGENGLANIEVGTQYEPTPSGMSERLNVSKIGSHCKMSFRLESIYHEEYAKGKPFEDVMEGIFNAVEDRIGETDELSANMNNFTDYAWAKDHLALFAIPLHSDTKDRFPTITVGCVELGVRVCIKNDELGFSSFAVTKDILKAYGITKATLFKDAKKCAPKIFPMDTMTMGSALGLSKEEEEEAGVPPIYIATVNKAAGGIGAAVIGYADFFKRAAELMEGDFYIVPSSTDEVLLMPAAELSKRHVLSMLRTANDNTIPHELLLSYNAMLYDVATETLEIVEAEEV